MLIPRFSVLVCIIAWCWILNISSQASEMPPQKVYSFTQFNYGTQDKSTWSSNTILGESPLVLFFATKDTEKIPSHSWLTIVASNQSVVAQLQTGTREIGTTLLYDEKDKLRHQFQLQKYGITPNQSALVIIDRAGWLRAVHKVENTHQLEKLLATIGDPTPPFQVGLPAPDFSMLDMNGVSCRPLDLKGKKYLLLTFFPKCFTGTCSKQLESLRNAWPQLQENDVEVWGVSVDPAAGEKGQRAFAEFLKLPFPLLPDTGRNLSILYGAAQSPNQTSSRMSVLIDKQGIVRWIDKQINPTTHGLDVVAKVEELEKLDAQKKAGD